MARTKDGGSVKQEYSSEKQGANPLPIWKNPTPSVLGVGDWTEFSGLRDLVSSWKKSVLYAMANIQERGRSYTLSITAASIKAN